MDHPRVGIGGWNWGFLPQMVVLGHIAERSGVVTKRESRREQRCIMLVDNKRGSRRKLSGDI